MRVRAGYWVRGMVLGGYWEGLYRCTTQLLEEGPVTSGAGPGSPTGAGVGGLQEPDVRGAADGPHPAGPVGPPLVALPGTILRLAPPQGQ